MRKLAIFSFSASAAIFLSQYIMPLSWQPYIGGAAFILAALTALLFRERARRLAVLTLLGLGAGSLWNWGYVQVLLSPSWELEGDGRRVTAAVETFPVVEDYGAYLDVRIEIEGGRDSLARAYVFSHELDGTSPGDIVEFTADISRAGELDGDELTYFTSQGYVLLASDVRDVEFISSPGFTLRYIHRYAQRTINGIVQDIFPLGTAPFMEALITGDRTDISRDVGLVSAMERTGVSHIVAVSGMHISILAGALSAVLGRRRRTALITAPVLLLFMGISGFSASVVRAVIMQFFVLFAPFFDRENDSITSLSAALLLILAINPYAAAGIGLQLSFGATLGIILFSPKMNNSFNGLINGKLKKRGLAGRALRSMWVSLSTTISAMVFTLPLSALYFGFVSIVSPLVNLLVLWAVSPAFVLGTLAVAVGAVWAPAGAVVAWIPAIFCRVIIVLVELFAKPLFAGIYLTRPIYSVWFVAVYCFVLLFIFTKASVRRLILPGSLAVTSLCVMLVGTALANNVEDGFTITALDVGQGQSLVVFSGDKTALIDCGSSSGEDAGAIAQEYIMSRGRSSIDLLILTHYHEDHANGAEYLISTMDIEALIVPRPLNDQENAEGERILALAREAGIDIIYVDRNMTADMGDAELDIFTPVGGKDENERGIFILVSHGDFDVFITGDADAASEIQISGREELPDIECLIVGHHGSAYSTSRTLLQRVRPEAAVISVGDNSYGHPSEETISRLEEYGVRVYRTDIHGDVLIDSREQDEKNGKREK